MSRGLWILSSSFGLLTVNYFLLNHHANQKNKYKSPHRYYVCVFGGALLESCTGGLMYSNELQTCDWPRNVNQNYCHGNNTLQETIPKKPQKSRGHQRTTPPPTTSYVYKPIKIENYSDLSSVIATRNEQEEEGARSGRSYAQSGPEKEFYNKNAGVGGLTGRSVLLIF